MKCIFILYLIIESLNHRIICQMFSHISLNILNVSAFKPIVHFLTKVYK